MVGGWGLPGCTWVSTRTAFALSRTPALVFGVWGLGIGARVWCVVCGVRCAVCGVWCAVWSVVCGVWCVVCGVWCVVCGVWCVVCGLWCGVWELGLGPPPLTRTPRRRALPPRAAACRARSAVGIQFENNYFTEICRGSEAGSYLRLIDFVYHSTLGLRVIKEEELPRP